MTSDIKGIQHPLPIGARAFPLPPTRADSQTFQPPPRSWPHHTSFPKPNAPTRANSDDASEPPFKKPKLGSVAVNQFASPIIEETPKAVVTEVRPESECISGIEEQKPRVHPRPLFPLKPGGQQFAGKSPRSRPLALERAARRDVVPVKAYVPEAPSYAPRYHENGMYRTRPADFFPWTGYQAEDTLNEHTTKQGHHDKIYTSQNESSTARPSVWSSLKHKSGLHILSSLLVSALDQRQVHGTVSSNSTFKPPPRVTLTDTKREAWLRDLANPLIPLRRLSRTIPHGIRGRILLDHCLSKAIPTSRAVWLAKCVGANEIRAFKRKGTGGVFTVGGETKWLKDWTSNIEQFLESIIATCGSPEWKIKINYGLRLASHLYSEHLLDRDHYLDWLLTSLEDSDLDSLPIWLLVQQIYQQELLQHRQRGRRLACAVVEHMLMANKSVEQDLYRSVLHQLVQLSRLIMMSASACYLLPNDWSKYKDTLKDCLVCGEDNALKSCFTSICERNITLQIDSSQAKRRLQGSPKLAIIVLLDTLAKDPQYSKVAGQCLHFNNSRDTLVRTCIEWSSSVHRNGRFRTYAAARLLRIWNRYGVELQRPVFDFLATDPDHKAFNRRDLYRLFAALVSSKHLSVGRYLQWLMARGTLHGFHHFSPDYPCDVGFLFELPLHGLPSHVLNLRQTLVSSTRVIPAKPESLLIQSIKATLFERIPDFFAHIQPLPDPSMPAVVSVQLTQTIKSDVARWIREAVIKNLQTPHPVRDFTDHDQQIETANGNPSIVVTLEHFQIIRRALEDMEELNILADVLNLISDRATGPVLAAISHTANFHSDVLSAIGATNQLFQKLYSHVRVGQDRELDGEFLESLFDLGCRLSGVAKEMQRIRKEMSARVPKASTVACSPISDTMVEAVQMTEPNFADEIDQMLASGTSMDKQTLTRVFGALMGHLEKSSTDSSHLAVRFSQLLARLRGFGPQVYDTLLTEQLQIWLEADALKLPSVMLASMICSKIFSLEFVLNAIIQNIESMTNQVLQAKLALNTLDFLCRPYSESIDIEYQSYRLLDNLKETIQKTPIAIVTIIHRALEAGQADFASRIRVESLISSNSLQALAHAILLQCLNTAEEVSPGQDGSYLNAGMQNAIGIILHGSQSECSTLSAFRDKVSNVLCNISEINIFLVPLELKAVLTSASIPLADSTDVLSKVIIDRAIASTSENITLWAYLVSEMTAAHASTIREIAEGETLAWALEQGSATSKSRNEYIPTLVSIIEASASRVPVEESSPFDERLANTLIHTLQSLWLRKAQCELTTSDDHDFQRLDVLLRLLVVHQSTIQHPKYPQTVLFQLLKALSLFLLSPLVNSNAPLSHRIFDILCLLTDTLPDDTRSRCINSLRDIHHVQDRRLNFIFGYSNNSETEWLQLTSKASLMPEPRSGGSAFTIPRPYPVRPWEMMQDATPVATENDTSLSLTLFGSRKSVL